MKERNHTNNRKVIVMLVFIILAIPEVVFAGGLFGPPQPVSKEEGGLNTAIGYWLHEDKFKNGTEHVIKQNQVYSHVGYGARYWEIYARIGVSDLKISDAFASTLDSTTTSKGDFWDNWKFYGTLGAKGFYPFNKTFGIGAFTQGSYSFNDFRDNFSGTQAGAPFSSQLRVKNLWDVNFGLGFQATVPYGIKLYIGPYAYYSEARLSLAANIPGLNSDTQNLRIHNETNVGGFTGIDIPISRGFHLNVEGQYSARFSAGAAIAYSY